MPVNGYIPEVMTQTKPSQASQLSLPSVRILANMNPVMAATATKTAVQVPWFDTALKPIETLNIADPQTNVQSGGIVD